MVREILKEKRLDPRCVQLQIAGYRNYSSGVYEILEVSNWESDSLLLRQFLETLKASKGQHNEVIEVGLRHCNREHQKKPILQVILVGDMPPNDENEV